MPFYKKSNMIGQQNEIKFKSQIEERVGCELQNTTKYNTFDFINEDKKILVEFKCRNCFRNNYTVRFTRIGKLDNISLYHFLFKECPIKILTNSF